MHKMHHPRAARQTVFRRHSLAILRSLRDQRVPRTVVPLCTRDLSTALHHRWRIAVNKERLHTLRYAVVAFLAATLIAMHSRANAVQVVG